MSEYMKARPTTYKGIKMRSRLEAGFARWLDSWPALTWQYEPQAFASDKGQYLPDFVADGMRCAWADGVRRVYFECKPYVFGCRTEWDEDPGGFSYEEMEKGWQDEQALMRRMMIIWESEPDALLVLAKQRKGPWADFQVIFGTDDDDPSWVLAERVNLVQGTYDGRIPCFHMDSDPAVPPWPTGYWNSI